MTRNHTTTILLLLLAQTATAAETRIFDWHEADGVVSYSNTLPPPGTKDVTSREIDTRTLTPAQRMAARTQLEHIDATEQAAANLSLKQIDAADLAINSALKRLSEAHRNLRTGRVPLGSDRIGTTDGRSRCESRTSNGKRSWTPKCRQPTLQLKRLIDCATPSRPEALRGALIRQPARRVRVSAKRSQVGQHIGFAVCFGVFNHPARA